MKPAPSDELFLMKFSKQSLSRECARLYGSGSRPGRTMRYPTPRSVAM